MKTEPGRRRGRIWAEGRWQRRGTQQNLTREMTVTDPIIQETSRTHVKDSKKQEMIIERHRTIHCPLIPPCKVQQSRPSKTSALPCLPAIGQNHSAEDDCVGLQASCLHGEQHLPQQGRATLYASSPLRSALLWGNSATVNSLCILYRTQRTSHLIALRCKLALDRNGIMARLFQ